MEGIQANKAISQELWHRRLGHPSSQALSKVFSDILINISSKYKDRACDVCLRAKQSRIPFPVSESKVSQCFDLIHCDIWGGYRVKSFCGASYSLTMLDNVSRGVWTYLIQEKSEASQLVKIFCVMVKT